MIESDDIASVLAPISVTDTMVKSITTNGVTLPEDTRPAWSSTAIYGIGDQVYSGHRVYESVQPNNTGKDPTVLSNQYSAAGIATWWIDAGPTNRFAMFDTLISTQTVALGPLTIVLTPGAFNGIALFGLDGDALEVSVKDAAAGNIVYRYSAPLEGSQPTDYYDYFFLPFKPQTQFIATGLAPYSSSEIAITVSKASGTAKIGMVALGDMKPLGAPLRGASVEPVDYSYISTDAFGNTTIRKRNNATGLTIQAKLDVEDANEVLRTVKDLLGVPVVVVGSTASGYENLTVFGLLSGRLQYDDYNEPTLNATVKGLI